MAVTAEDIEVSVGGVQLLSPTSFRLKSGESLAIRGANGSGKTTLLRVVAGVVSATAGSITVHGSVVDDRRPEFRRALAALIGLPPLARDLTLYEHLVLVGLSWGHHGQEAEEAAERLLAAVGLSKFRERYPHELSSGQTQLFAIATVFCRPSSVLVLDEPEQRLDVAHLSLVSQLIVERLSAGSSVLFATHDSELVKTLGARSLTVAMAEDARQA